MATTGFLFFFLHWNNGAESLGGVVVVLHDVADLVQQLGEVVLLQGVDEGGQAGVGVPQGPAPQSRLRSLRLRGVAAADGQHLRLARPAQRLEHAHPLGPQPRGHHPQEVHTWRGRQGQTDGQTDGWMGRETRQEGRQTDRETDRNGDRQTERQICRQVDRQVERQTH